MAIAMLVMLAACAGQIPRPTPPQARWAAQRWPGATPEALEQGRSLYIRKCSGCHTLRVPAVYSQERWPQILDKMQKRAKLSEADKESILHYVLSVKQPEEHP
jgi:mono/diheme cytochrome c family protein